MCNANKKIMALLATKKIQMNETPDFCSNCGACCTNQPGGYAPDQFESNEEIVAMLRSGDAVLDWWIGSGDEDCDDGMNIYYLRPRMKSDPKYRAARYPQSSPCLNLKEYGCSLSWEDRPHGCRTLKATAPKTCESMHGYPQKHMMARAWRESAFDLLELEKWAEAQT